MSEPAAASSAPAAEDAFTSELRWCIAQLELGLKRADCTPEQGLQLMDAELLRFST